MIKNKLSELLSERGLKTSRVAKDVGIARSSLTSMIYNDNEMLRYDSIDKLCRYLNITPTDFFEFVPMDIDMVAENTFQILNFVSTDNLMDLAETIRFISLECELLIDIEYKNEKSSFDCIVFLEKISYEGANNKFIFKIKNENSFIELKEMISLLTPGLKNILFKKVNKILQSHFMNAILKEADSEIAFPDFNVNEKEIILNSIKNATFVIDSKIISEY